MVAVDSQIRYTTLRILNKLQSFIDLSRSPYLPDQFEQYLLELLNNEPTLQVLDEVIPLAAKFQHRNEQFISGSYRSIKAQKLERVFFSSFSQSINFLEMARLFRSTTSSHLHSSLLSLVSRLSSLTSRN